MRREVAVQDLRALLEYLTASNAQYALAGGLAVGLWAEHLLKDDLSIVELLSADYTYLNERLARHYGVPGVKGEAFRKVTLTDGRRGGVVAKMVFFR